MDIFSDDRQKSLQELLDVVSKGINLLANENLDKDLYDAFEKYAFSTVKMLDEAYGKNYISNFIQYNQDSMEFRLYNYNDFYMKPTNPLCNHSLNSFNIPYNSFNNYTKNTYTSFLFGQNNTTTEYREKLKNLLQQLTSVAKMVVYE